MRGPSRAFELLCAVARPRPDLERARDVLKQGVDVDALFSLADWHSLRPALRGLAELETDRDRAKALRAAFETFARPHALRTLAIADELLRIADTFSTAGLPFLVFKGPVLALQLYDGPAQREYADIDVLVPPDRAETAKALLATLGYRNLQGDPAFVRTFLGAQRQVALHRPGFDPAVDLHWAFSGGALPFPLDPAETWSRLVPVKLGGRAIPALGAADLALLLAGHGTKEAWIKLGWVADFARLVDRHPELDWAGLLARARARRSGDAVLLAAAMADRLLGTPVPAALAQALAASDRVAGLAERLSSDLALGPGQAPREHLHDVLLCDRASDRLWVHARTAVTPSAGDYHALPLPRALWPLYWLTRPIRLAGRALRRT